MRLKHNKTAKGECYYIIRSVYKNGKNVRRQIDVVANARLFSVLTTSA